MKLDKVVLNGFKSFADKTEFEFNVNVTAIVGPNGCGKSNVVDAVKWVLGEQSAKNLRSGQMADVIFSGSGSRKASGMAEVGLYFSNVATAGGGQTDLQVTRRLYRSGESEYLINDKTARLKDIRELFMDTGIGTRAYSIIEQGQVEQLVTANKIDRRGLFEEAAGISKFKAHKKEAIRKMERTEQNLIRLADIVSEIQRQLRSIKLQAGKARNYLQYTEKLKELRVNYSLAEYHQLKTGIEERNGKLATIEQEFGQVVADVGRNDALLSELTSEIITTENEINRTDNSLIAVKSKIEQHNERISTLQSRIEELNQRKVKASEQIRIIADKDKEFTEQIEAGQSQLEQSKVQYEQRQSAIKNITGIVHEIDLACNSIQANLDDEKSGIIDIVRRTAQLHNEIGSLNASRDSLAGQKDRLHGRASAAETELHQLLTTKAQYQARLGDIENILGDLQQSLEQKKQQMELLNIELSKTTDALASKKEARSAAQSELNILTEMEDKREGLNKAVKNILQQAGNNTDGRLGYIDGIVADIIRAEPEYAAAVEAGLEGISDAVVVNSTAKFLEDTETRQNLKGRVNWICADKAEPFVDTTDMSSYPSVQGRLIEFVNFDSRYASLAWKLLGKIILVSSLDDAIELADRLGNDYRFVSLAGEIFAKGNMITTGPMAQASGLISRKSRIAQLGSDLEQISREIERLTQEFEKHSQENKHISGLCQDLRTSVYEANTEKTEANSKLSSVEQNIRRLSDEQPLIKGEIEMLETQIAASVQREHESRRNLEELEAVRQQRDERIETLETQLDEKRSEDQKYNEELTELKVELGRIVEQQKARSAEIASLQGQIQHGRMMMESARTEMLTSDSQVKQAQRGILASQAEISELFMKKEQAQNASIELHSKVEEKITAQQETEQIVKSKRALQRELEEQIHQIKLDLGQLQVKRDDLCQRVQEELNMDLAQAYQDYQHDDIDWSQVRDEIATLRGKVERLGNVNVDAISQQAELEERNEFLTKQVEDLNTSKEQLQQLINKINRQSREKFKTTFEQVRANFQILFRKLFGGGKADVILENPEDILESGIDIIARPPGKELRSISLLSGGEKTLTAIALLFAVFKSRPSPFCILDEVDAALDETNNERFNLIVEEFKKKSQFVIVTHSKRTMSIADVLFGVTMQIQGVSKKISVKFDQEETESAVA